MVSRILSAVAAGLLLFLLTTAGSGASASVVRVGQTQKKVYVCPPCGQACDNKVYNAPGKCETCGMTLVERTPEQVKVGAFKSKGKVAVLLFPGVDIIDFSGPWEVFGSAGYDVFTVAAKADPVHTSFAQTIVPDYTFENCPKADILLLPGGNVPNISASDPEYRWVKKMTNETPHTLTVCTGVYWLAQTGQLDGLSATTMHGMYDMLAQSFPKIHVVSNKRFVDNGRIITSAGLSSGIDGAFHMVEKLNSTKFARTVALGLEYNWQPSYVRGVFADKYLDRLGSLQLPNGANAKMRTGVGDANRWEAEFDVSPAKSSEQEIMHAVDGHFAKAWRKVRETSSGGKMTSAWRFKGDDKKTWTAEVCLKKAGSAFVLSTTLHKAGVSRSS